MTTSEKPETDTKPRKKIVKRKKKSPMSYLIILVAMILGIGTGYFFLGGENPHSVTQETSKEDRKILGDMAAMLEEYREAFDRYPADLRELIDFEWITSMPVDMHKRPMRYKTENNGHAYEFRSSGKDGRFNTPDDVCLKTINKNDIPFRFFTCASTKDL